MNIKRMFIYGIIWFVNFTILLLIILLPKNEKLFTNLYYVFVANIFFVPGILLILQTYENIKEQNSNLIEYAIPSIGTISLMSLVFVNFIKTIKTEVIQQMIFILFTFVLVELLITYLLSGLKKYDKKKCYLGAISIYLTLIMFYFVAMIMSYDHSIIW